MQENILFDIKNTYRGFPECTLESVKLSKWKCENFLPIWKEILFFLSHKSTAGPRYSRVGGKYANLHWCELPELTNWVKYPKRCCNFVSLWKTRFGSFTKQSVTLRKSRIGFFSNMTIYHIWSGKLSPNWELLFSYYKILTLLS